MAICDKRITISFLVNEESLPIAIIPKRKPASPKRATKSKDSNRLWSEKDIEYLLNKITPDILEFLAPNEKETLWHGVADRLDRTVIAIQKKYYKLIQSGILLPKNSRESLQQLNRKLKIKSNNFRNTRNGSKSPTVFAEYPSISSPSPSNPSSSLNSFLNSTSAAGSNIITVPSKLSNYDYNNKYISQHQENFYNEITLENENRYIELPPLSVPSGSRSSSPFFDKINNFQ